MVLNLRVHESPEIINRIGYVYVYMYIFLQRVSMAFIRVFKRSLLWVELCPPKKDTSESQPLVPQNVNLFGHGIFKEGIKLK